MLPTVSVIIPTFNRARVLTRAMESVVKQDFDGWELLISDDGSTDETAQTVQSFQEKHHLGERCRYLASPQGNRGVSAARNRAAREARGEWLAFLDSDDEWLPHKLSRQLHAASGHHPLVHGEEIWIRDGRRVNPMRKHAKSGGRIFRRCVDLCCISPSAAMIRREWFVTAGGFREDFPVCEDYELWLRLSACFEVAFVANPVLIKYGGHEDQLSRRFRAMDYFRVKALLPFLNENCLSTDDRLYVASHIQRKSAILLHGYRKHANLENYAEVEDWERRAFTALQMAHSAAERMPLSENSSTL